MAESVARQDLERRRLVTVVKVLWLVDRPFNATAFVAVASVVAFAEETFDVDADVGDVDVVIVVVVVRVRHDRALRFRVVEAELGLLRHERLVPLVEAA